MYFTSSSDIVVFSSLQAFDTSERVSGRLVDNMDLVYLFLEICLSFEGMVIKLESDHWNQSAKLDVN